MRFSFVVAISAAIIRCIGAELLVYSRGGREQWPSTFVGPTLLDTSNAFAANPIIPFLAAIPFTVSDSICSFAVVGLAFALALAFAIAAH